MYTEDNELYLDNAATTWPKPTEVYSFMDEFYKKYGFNVNRGSSNILNKCSYLLSETRELLCNLFNGKDINNVVFVPSLTVGINIVLQGLNYEKGDIIYTTKYEHNAVLRTLNYLKKKNGIIIKELPISSDFKYDLNIIKQIFEKEKIKLLVLNHASNVFGLITPIKEIFEIAKKNGIITVLDSAQTAGLLDIDVAKQKIDFLVFSGHKGLYGPFGVAGILVNSNVKITPIIYGGTGSNSEAIEMPDQVPQKFEAGSLNIQAIAGLNMALKWLNKINHKNIYEHDMELFRYYSNLMKENPNVISYISNSIENHVPVLSFNVKNQHSANENYSVIEKEYNIIARSGLHCAPSAHKLLGTIKNGGTIRLSFSYFSKKDPLIDKMLREIK